MTPEVVGDGYAFPECPRWHGGALWFSDVYAGRVHRLDVATGASEVVAEVEGHPAGLGFLPDGSLLVAEGLSRRVLRVSPGAEPVVHADLSQVATWHLNDMHVDAAGRAYVGNYGDASVPPDPPLPAALALVQPSGAVSVAAEGLEFANGIGLLSSGTLVVAETRSVPGRLTAFSVGTDGSLSDRRVLAELDVMPDGIAVAPDDSVWVASPFTSELLHVSPSGAVVERLAVPTPYAVATDGERLWVCSSPTWVPAEALAARAGAVLRVR